MPQSVSEEVYGLNIQMDINNDVLCQRGPVWTINDPSSNLSLGQSLYSPSRAFRLFGQSDGNFVLQYAYTSELHGDWPNSPRSPGDITWITYWATKSQDRGADHLAMQYDGNLVIQHKDNTRLGQFGGGGLGQDGDNTRTYGNPEAFLRLQDDGNLVIYAQGGHVIWESHTSVAESQGANV